MTNKNDEKSKMSEKRFSETERACFYTSLVLDNSTKEELGTNKVVDLLNSLSDENEQLRKKNERLQSILHIVEVNCE